MNILFYHSYVQSRRVGLREDEGDDKSLTRLLNARERNGKFGQQDNVSGGQKGYIFVELL